jgi:sporulation protein YlmC with PRC-barrel domain
MKISEFIGTKVISKDAKDVGKVEELSIKLKNGLVDMIFMVDTIFIVTGSSLSPLNKKYIPVAEEDIEALGDYLQLNLDADEIEKRFIGKIEDLVPKGSRFKDFKEKIVLTKDGIEVGKISDMILDPNGCLVPSVIVSTGKTFNKKKLMICEEDIESIGDYMILKLEKGDIEQRIVD